MILTAAIGVLIAAGCARHAGQAPVPAGATGSGGDPGPPWDHEWACGAVFYEVFVRSFQDSDGDGVGDLPGLISRLDYLNDGNPAGGDDLGVDALWLMPVFRSPSYHGYDTVDYTRVQSDYGSNEYLERLCAEAHRRGMRVILDFVLNHLSSEHPWFVSARTPGSAKRDWFVWRRDNPGWTQPWGGNNPTWHQAGDSYYYGVFWGGMPDLNYRNPEVLDAMQEYARLWLDRGVDGFRLDATRHLVEDGADQQQVDTPETHAVLRRFSAFTRTVKPQAVLVGENWTQTEIIVDYFGSNEKVAGGDELPMNFNFPLAGAILDGVRRGDAAGITAKLDEVRRLYPEDAIDAPFLTNHDMARVATQLNGDAGRLRLSASILLTLPGAPFLYYGEEIGLLNGPGGQDEWKRTPMAWDASTHGGFSTGEPWFRFSAGRDSLNVASQSADSHSILSHYRRLIRARQSSTALRRGSVALLAAPDQSGPILAYLRQDEAERVWVVHNLGATAAMAGPFDLGANACEPIFATATDGRSLEGAPNRGLSGDELSPTPARGEAGWTVELPPRASAAWRLR